MKTKTNDKKKGLPMVCDNKICKHKWNYQGISTKEGQYATCPACKRSVKIGGKKNGNKKK